MSDVRHCPACGERSYEQPVRGVDLMYGERVTFKPSMKLRRAVLAILLYHRMQARG